MQLGPGAPGAGRWQPKEEDCFGHISSLNRRRPPPPGSVPGAGALLQRRGHRPSTGPGQASGLMHACVTCVGRRLHGVATSSHQPRAPVVGVAYPAGPETRAQVHRPRRRTSQSGALPGAPGRHRWRCAPWRPAWEAALRRRRHAHGSAIAAQRADLCRPVPAPPAALRKGWWEAPPRGGSVGRVYRWPPDARDSRRAADQPHLPLPRAGARPEAAPTARSASSAWAPGSRLRCPEQEEEGAPGTRWGPTLTRASCRPHPSPRLPSGSAILSALPCWEFSPSCSSASRALPWARSRLGRRLPKTG